MRKSLLRMVMVVIGVGVGVGVGAASAQPLVRPEAHPGGILLVVTDTTGLVSNSSPLFLASNAGGWNAGDTAMQLTGRSDLRWQIMLPGPVMGNAEGTEGGGSSGGAGPRFEFKLTRGSWETCEVDADLGDIPNRTLEPVDAAVLEEGKPYIVELTIEGFVDQREGAVTPRLRTDSTQPLNVTGNAFRLQVVGGAGAAKGSLRDVTVWLPPGYDDEANAGRHYPVLYLQDGQNVFDFMPPTPGEWRADETATALIEAGEIEPIVIVAIPHSGANRTAEYLPGAKRWTTMGGEIEDEFTRLGKTLGVTPGGDAYLDWLVAEVVPRVERVVRASPDPADRGIGGASLGGLLGLRAAQLHAGVFGRLLCESPSLTARGADLTDALTAGLELRDARVFVGVGGSEYGDDPDKSAALVRAVQRAAERLGASGAEVSLLIEPNAGHTEAAWADRFDEALVHLYPAETEE
ncbi:MAG: alpha/beta hydrolase-fold protein [Planctomycetota bacterium]|nr:alpha/beta hydrolase-fold protein [Planctomycetota bacterium]